MRSIKGGTGRHLSLCGWTWGIAIVIGLVGLSANSARAAAAYVWGRNEYGQIGDGTTTDRNAPVAVSGLGSGVTAVAGGLYHSVALQNGALYAWGDNTYVQVGDGTTTERHTPVAVSGMGSGVTTLAGGGYHSMAVQNGALYAWGGNFYGQLGDGTTTNPPTPVTPVAVSGLGNDVTVIAGGYAHSLAVQNGALYAWGYNSNGQIGDDTTTDRNTPFAVSGMDSGVTAIAGGAYHSLAVKNGALYAWGRNAFGEVGDGTSGNNRTIPVAVSGLGSGVTAVGAAYHSLAVQNGAVYAWGRNDFGQLGNGTRDSLPHPTPTLVSGLSDITDVAAGAYSSYALAGDGSLWAWGLNDFGQLGLGDTIRRLTPTQILAPAGYQFASIDVYAGGRHVLATVVTVPEPGALSLLAFGGLALLRRRHTG